MYLKRCVASLVPILSIWKCKEELSLKDFCLYLIAPIYQISIFSLWAIYITSDSQYLNRCRTRVSIFLDKIKLVLSVGCLFKGVRILKWEHIGQNAFMQSCLESYWAAIITQDTPLVLITWGLIILLKRNVAFGQQMSSSPAFYLSLIKVPTVFNSSNSAF